MDNPRKTDPEERAQQVFDTLDNVNEVWIDKHNEHYLEAKPGAQKFTREYFESDAYMDKLNKAKAELEKQNAAHAKAEAELAAEEAKKKADAAKIKP